MSKRCYYETLEVERSVDEGQLKAAYRKLAMKWHPDRNPGDKTCEAKFKEINEAYDVLKDGDKRAAYDRFGHAAFENGGRPGQGPGGFSFDFGSGFADIFDMFFGGRGGARPQRRGPQPGPDAEVAPRFPDAETLSAIVDVHFPGL